MVEGMATIEVTASHMASSIAQDLVNPTIEIDSEPRECKWGVSIIAVSPGRHTLKAYHKWLVFSHAYASSTTVDIGEGETIRLEWHTGAAAFRPGAWSVLSS